MKRSMLVFVAMAGLFALGVVGCGVDTTPTSSNGGTSPNSGQSSADGTSSNGPSAESPGELTVGTTEGPYYVTGTAMLQDGDLNHTGLAGEVVRVVGHVYGGASTSKPLSGAKIELWQADADGSYHPNANGDASQYKPSDLALRGYVLSASDGSYSFTTIYPGQYPGRTRHIHMRVSASAYGAVATQLIVPAKSGDAMTPENDAIARSLPSANHVTFTDAGGMPTATFDVHLGAD